MERVTGRATEIGYCSSVWDFCYNGGRLGSPTLVAGPQEGNFHAADEFVEIDSVIDTTSILFHLLEEVTRCSGATLPADH